MKIAEFSVNRRVTILMLTILIIILGGITFTKLGLEMLPDMDYPVISVVTTYEGASSQDVEETITKTLETAIAAVKDIKKITSESMEGTSLIMVEFNWGSNLDFAAQDLRDVIDQITDYLPDEVSRPLVMKFNLSQMPVLLYGVTGMEDTYKLRQILDDEVAAKLKHIKGVATVMVMGGDEAEKQIIVDKQKLDFYDISLEEIIGIVAAGNLNMAAHHIMDRKDDYLLRTMAQYKTLDELKRLPIKVTLTGKTIYLRDLAEVINGYKEFDSKIRTNKQRTAMMWISKESGSNTLTVARRVKKKLKEMSLESNNKLEFNEIMDMGKPISKVTKGAMGNLIIGGLLSIIIMFIFLRNWRPTLAISLAIPISVIATFIPIYLAKYSLNIMTLGGLALGVGMLVDNSIVVIENIYRHMEMGRNKMDAAKLGASEVAMAITASTLTTVAVFFPMIFAEGMTGVLIRGLALTVAFSLFASLFVSLTIVPVIASVIFKHNRSEEKSSTFFDKIKGRYLKILPWCLKHRGLTILIVVVLLISSLGLIPMIGAEFMPEQEMPMLMMNVKLPPGSSLEDNDLVMSHIEDIFAEFEDIQHYMVLVGPMSDTQAKADPTNPQEVNESQVFARLKDKIDREYSSDELQELIRSKLPAIEGAQFNFMSQAEMMGSGSASPVELSIFGKDLEKLQEISTLVADRMEKTEFVSDVVNSMKEGKPEFHIIIDRDKAFQYGLTAYQIASTVKAATMGSVAGIFRSEGDEIDIRVRLQKSDRDTFSDVLHLGVKSPLGFTVPLNQIATLQPASGPKKISHEKQSRKVKVSANIVGSNNMAGVVKSIQGNLKDVEENLPTGYFIEYGGAYKDMNEAFVTLALALLLAIVLVYIVMASQFESLSQPFIVMFTMPLGIIGIMLALAFTGTNLSVASFVGAIILSGIVVNNGIVLIDHMNQLRTKGMDKLSAIMQAGSDRIRPVLITASTTILGMLPMALSRGEGSELKAPMALTVIGGLISATFLTLFVIPVIYSLFSKKKKIKDA